MKSLFALVAVVVAVAISPIVAQDSPPARGEAPTVAAPQKWQHLALEREASKPLSDPEFAAKINRLGADGWEMVTVLNHVKDGTTTKTIYYFKKPLP